jgi:hypothetical protein
MADEANDQTRQNPPQQAQAQPGQHQPRRQHDGRPRQHHYRDRQPRPAAPTQPAAGLAEEKVVGLDDEDTEQEKAAQPSRGGGNRGHRGKPEKKKYEEFINDPYCE